MAEFIVSVVAEHLVSEALSLAAQELSLVYNFKDNLESLAEELIFVQALMSDADSKDFRSVAMRFWLGKLKAVAFDTEDVLDEYKYELLRQKVSKMKLEGYEYEPLLRKKVSKMKLDKVRSFFSPIRKLAFRRQMAHKIKDITSHLQSVKQLGMGYGLSPFQFLTSSSQVKILDPVVLTSPSVNESDIVGRVHDVEKVSEMLLSTKDDRENISVVAVVGMAGLGKTALAQLVYKYPQVVNHFQEKIWVCVSKHFEITRLLNDMLQSIGGQNDNLTNKEAIIKELQKTLKGARYLLVLDDVWNEVQEKWDAMERDLREIGGSLGTKVLVTTRTNEVASVMHASQSTHRLNPLAKKDGLDLLKKRAFAEGGAIESPKLVKVGERLLERCGGMALAIKALGSLLYSKKHVSEWLRIEKSDIWSSNINSNQVLSSIKLSYNHLSSVSLKQCFAYCSIFPKNIEIERENLIQLWMAQGFLNPPEGSSLQMKDVGNNFFDILLWNGLLQEPKYDKYNNISSCKMHDVVHDFALHISRDYCVTKDVGSDFNDVTAVHISLLGSSEGEMIDMSQGVFPNARTLFIPSGVIENMLLKFGCLRTLILGDREIKRLPNSIGSLKLLRYINVTGTQITTLPTSFRKLYNLQTLRIDPQGSGRIFLSTLINLRHIYFSWNRSRKCVLVGIKHLVHLQTLPYFYLSDKENSSKIEDLGPLHNLRGCLVILGLDKVKNGEEAEKAKISKKPKVEHLELHSGKKMQANLNENDIFEKLKPHSNLKSLKIFKFMGSKFPSWMMTRNDSLLHNLVELTLENCTFCEQLPPLGHLPRLERLKIKGLDNVKCIGAEFYGCFDLDPYCMFPALTSLKIMSMENLEEWIGAEHSSISVVNKAFPCLRKLDVSYCGKLVELPSLQSLSSLTKLRINYLANLVALPSIEGLLSLTKLTIKNLKNLATLPSIESLSSLTELTIKDLGKLAALPSMEGLSSLTKLTIEDLGNLATLPSMKGLSSLTELTIKNLRNLVALPSIEALSLLTKLRIKNLGNLATLSFIEGLSSLTELRIENLRNLATLPSIEGFSSLTELTIGNLENLVAIPSMEGLSCLKKLTIKDLRNLAILPSMEGLSSLKELTIGNLGNLATLPSMEGLLSLKKLTIENLGNLAASLSMEGLSSLKELTIENFENLAALPAMKGLSSLTKLTIQNVKNLATLPSMGGVSSLTMLTIKNIENLTVLPSMKGLLSLKTLEIGRFSKDLDYFPWPQSTIPRAAISVENGDDAQFDFPFLESLTLHGWSKLKSLPPLQLSYLPSLRDLMIVDFGDLKTLPEWLGNIYSLDSLSLYSCQNLEYMPSAETMQRLTNLVRLEIFDCNCLKWRCTSGSGTEWHKIAHIPVIWLDFERIESRE